MCRHRLIEKKCLTVYTISIIIGIVFYLTEIELQKCIVFVNLNYNKEKEEEEEEEEELCVILPYKTTYYTYLRVFTTYYFYYCTKVLTRAFFSLFSTLSAI